MMRVYVRMCLLFGHPFILKGGGSIIVVMHVTNCVCFGSPLHPTSVCAIAHELVVLYVPTLMFVSNLCVCHCA